MSVASSLSTRSLARASARHPWRTVALWVLLIVGALGLNSTLGADALTSDFAFTGDPQSQVARELMEASLGSSFSEVVIVQSETLTVDDPAFRERVESIFTAVSAHEGIAPVAPIYYEAPNPGFVSADRQTLIMPFALTGELDEAIELVEPVVHEVTEANGEGGFFVAIVGETSTSFETNELSVSDIEQGERFGIPTALLILLVLFGAVVAALIPLFLAIVAIIVALGMVAIVGQFQELVFFVTLMITMIGLAVGIDYSLIVVSRVREELEKGRDKLTAIEIAGATASRTVFFSGMTVVLALTGMLIVPTTIFQSLGFGAILVVIAAVAATLTLLPAVLALLGTKVNRLSLPFLRSRSSRHDDDTAGGFWNTTTRLVMRYPVIALVVAGGLMAVAAIPTFSLNQGFNGVDQLPDRLQAKQAFLILEEKFSFGAASPADVVVSGDATDPAVVAALEQLQAELATQDAFEGFSTITASPQGDLLVLSVPVAGENSSAEAVEAVTRLRDEIVPAAFAGLDVTAVVGGFTSQNIDFFDTTDRYTPIVFAFVLGLSFILLTIAFRSVVIPLKSIILNLLSVGAAYGLMVAVFQNGFLDSILPFKQSPIIDAWIPLFLFTVLFGLSMDYHVFLLSRVREHYDVTKDNAASVAYGLRSTAGLITGAALIMVAVFSGFASGEMVSNQQVGFGLAIAVFLDATIVRSILVPATMRLLGRLNWYYPSFLEWVPRVGIEGSEETVLAPAPAGASE